jgi:cbb3-type cytochrome c oxidase subunit III
MRQNKHLLLWSSLGVLALLIVAAVQENFLKEWRRIQRSALTEAGPVDVRLRQVVVPGLRTVDRCVTCHVGMAPGEQGLAGVPVTGAHKPVVHDPAEYGCTVCHGGQGRATEKADAHGDVHFWPQPMIPKDYAQAGCGSCHTHLKVPSQARLQQGENLFARYDCLSCHKADGRGGTLRPGGVGGMEGPDLSYVGLKGYDAGWYEKHLYKATQGLEPWKASFGSIPAAERQTLAVYLASRAGAPKLIEAKALFHSLGCRGCHAVGGVGGDDGPDLTRVGDKDPGQLDFSHVPGERTLTRWHAAHFRAPSKVVAGSQMPDLGLDEKQIDLLTFYMLSLRRSEFPEAYWPIDRIRAQRFGEREFDTDGATLYATFCAACHGAEGQGMRYPGMPAFPAVANPDFLQMASDEMITATVQRGRPGRRMPAWGEMAGGLRAHEIEAIVAHLRQLGGVPEALPDRRPERWAAGDVTAGGKLYSAHCASCHGTQGQGGEGPALSNKVLLSSATDTYLARTIGFGRRGTSMQGYLQGSTVRPALSPAEIEAIVSHIRTWE